MELNVGFFHLLKLLVRVGVHKLEERRLSTYEFEIIETNYGKVKGMQRKNAYESYGNYYAFEGIPFAKPPLGDLRFRAPQAPEPWDGVLDCLHYKDKPVQSDYIKRMVLGSEDCLYLNVYAKKLSSSKPLPVMVWIYGGGYQLGEASRQLYGPDYLMQKDVVLVQVTYRVGALGFLSLKDADLQIPGNAGIKDQVMALKWIKQNIEFFNGDPNNITIFGGSAGAAAAHVLMMSPQTKGLFHKAIMQSGTALCPWNNPPQSNWGYRLACIIGYKGDNNDKEVYRYLAKQNAKKLACRDTLLLTKEERFNNLCFGFGPVVEPYLSQDCIVSTPFKDLLESTWSNNIPVIIGGNSFEGLFHYATVERNHFLINDITDCVNLLPDDIITKHTPEELEVMASKLKQAYFVDKTPCFKETFFEYMDLMSYRTFWHANYRVVKARSAYATQAPTYCYLFDFDSEYFNHFRVINCGKSVRGVCHGDEISYLFYNVASGILLPTTAEFKCIQRMVGMWYNFALASNPNCKETDSVCWEPVGNETDLQKPFKVLKISDDLKFEDFPLNSKMELWNSFYTKESLY